MGIDLDVMTTNTIIAYMADIINKNLSEYGSLSINENLNMIIINEEKNKLLNLLDLCKKLDKEEMKEFSKIIAKKIELKYSKGKELAEYLIPKLSLDGKISIDENFNALWIYDHQRKVNYHHQRWWHDKI